MGNEFEKYARMARQLENNVAVCRCKHGHEELFDIPFENKDQLMNFLMRNNGDIHEMGFYCKGFSGGEYIGENT